MRKRDEIALPQSCWNKAKESEILFVLLERDEAMAETIRFWAAKRIEKGLNADGDPQIVEALVTANLLEGKPTFEGIKWGAKCQGTSLT